MTVLDLVRRYRRAEGWRGLAEFAGLLALDNQTHDLPALRRNADADAALFTARGAAMEILEPAARAPRRRDRLPGDAHAAQRAGRRAPVSVASRAAGRDALVMPTPGGSVPLFHVAEILRAPTVVLPIANHDNNQHAADENLRLGDLWYGVDLFSQLLTTPPATMEPPR